MKQIRAFVCEENAQISKTLVASIIIILLLVGLGIGTYLFLNRDKKDSVNKKNKITKTDNRYTPGEIAQNEENVRKGRPINPPLSETKGIVGEMNSGVIKGDDLSYIIDSSDKNLPLFKHTKEQPININEYTKLAANTKIDSMVLYQINENTLGDNNNQSLLTLFKATQNSRAKHLEKANQIIVNKLFNGNIKNFQFSSGNAIQGISIVGNAQKHEITSEIVLVGTGNVNGSKKEITYHFLLKTNQDGKVIDIFDEQLL